MLLVCLLSIGFASRAVYERRSTVVVDVKLTAYRARLTTHSDRDETFLAARKHLIEEQGKRKYFYREFPLVFVGSEGDRGDPMRREKSEKITVDDGFNVSGTRGEVRGDSE